MQYQMCITQASKQCPHQEKTVIFCTIFPPAFVSGLKSVSRVKQITRPWNKAALTLAYMWTSYSISFQTAEEGNAVVERRSCFLDHQQSRVRCPRSVFPLIFAGRAGADINIYILGSGLQHGSFHQDPGCWSSFLSFSPSALSCSVSTIFVTVKSTSVVRIAKLKMERILSECSRRRWEMGAGVWTVGMLIQSLRL